MSDHAVLATVADQPGILHGLTKVLADYDANIGYVDIVRPRDRADVGMAADARWRDRAATEHRATQVMLGRAEGTERASLEALARLKPPSIGEVQ